MDIVTCAIGGLQLEDESTTQDRTAPPIHCLPLEILGHIFEITIAPAMTSECMKRLNNICLVCWRWREAALVHHRLWSSLEVKAHFTTRVYEKVEAWFARSGTGSKSLVVTCPYHEWCWGYGDVSLEDIPCPFASPPLAKLLTQGPFLQHLSLCCPSSQCILYLMQQVSMLKPEPTVPCSWDRLKSLRLVVNREWAEEEPHHTVDEIFRSLPPVTSLHIHLPAFRTHRHPDGPGADQRRLVVPPSCLTRLTRLTLDCDWHHEFVLRTIRPCINLELLTLHFKSTTLGYSQSNPAELEDNAVKDAIFPRLTILRLRQVHPRGLRILRHVKNSILAELDLSFEVAGWSWRATSAQTWNNWDEHVAAHIRKSSCKTTLRRFRLHAITVSSRPFENLLTYYFPCVTELTLDKVKFNDQDHVHVLQGLIKPLALTDVMYLPQLRTLKFIQVSTPSRCSDTYPLGEDLAPSLNLRGKKGGSSRDGVGAKLFTISRESANPPQLDDEDSEWDSDSDGFDSWDFNLGVRESLVSTLEHDYL